jgi:hypothetical protein
LKGLLNNDESYLDFISSESRKQLMKGYLPGVSYEKYFQELTFYSESDESGAEMLYSGTEPKDENFSVFTFDDKKINIYFAEYQVGPYVIGTPVVVFDRNI